MKIFTEEFTDKFLSDYKIDEVVGVPCSTMKYFINYLCNKGIYRAFTNEGDAVSYAAGCITSGKNVAVLLQNSGLTNASSPISSLVSLYNIPMIYFIGYRGEDPSKDEPQHSIIGPNTKNLISDITNNAQILSLNEFIESDYIPLDHQIFILVTKDQFTPVTLSDNLDNDNRYSLHDVIKSIKEIIADRTDVSVLTTTGFTSRELMALGEDSPQNFYCLGSMGCLYSFAKGLASSNPNHKFIVIDGDGSTAMRFESTYSCEDYKNLYRIIIRNDCHGSTGKQHFDFSEFDKVLRIKYNESNKLSRLNKEVKRFINGHKVKPGFIIRVNSKVDKDSLPRPILTPEEIISNFKRGLNHE